MMDPLILKDHTLLVEIWPIVNVVTVTSKPWTNVVKLHFLQYFIYSGTCDIHENLCYISDSWFVDRIRLFIAVGANPNNVKS